MQNVDLKKTKTSKINILCNFDKNNKKKFLYRVERCEPFPKIFSKVFC